MSSKLFGKQQNSRFPIPEQQQHFIEKYNLVCGGAANLTGEIGLAFLTDDDLTANPGKPFSKRFSTENKYLQNYVCTTFYMTQSQVM